MSGHSLFVELELERAMRSLALHPFAPFTPQIHFTPKSASQATARMIFSMATTPWSDKRFTYTYMLLPDVSSCPLDETECHILNVDFWKILQRSGRTTHIPFCSKKYWLDIKKQYDKLTKKPAITLENQQKLKSDTIAALSTIADVFSREVLNCYIRETNTPINGQIHGTIGIKDRLETRTERMRRGANELTTHLEKMLKDFLGEKSFAELGLDWRATRTTGQKDPETYLFELSVAAKAGSRICLYGKADERIEYLILLGMYARNSGRNYTDKSLLEERQWLIKVAEALLTKDNPGAPLEAAYPLFEELARSMTAPSTATVSTARPVPPPAPTHVTPSPVAVTDDLSLLFANPSKPQSRRGEEELADMLEINEIDWT